MCKQLSLALVLVLVFISMLTGCSSKTITETLFVPLNKTVIQTTTVTETQTKYPEVTFSRPTVTNTATITPPQPRLVFSSWGNSDTPKFVVNKPNWIIEYEVSRDCFLTIKIQPYYDRYLIRSLLVKASDVNQITMEGYTDFHLYFSVEVNPYSTGDGSMLTVPEWTISVMEEQ